jgi:hypothetical protein
MPQCVIFGVGIINFNLIIFMNSNRKDSIVLYTDKRGNVELRADVEKNTLWATRTQVAKLFETTPQNITIHLGNIYGEGELNENSTSKESLLVQTEGGRAIKRLTDLYNLDVIIAVGYRINSMKATQFRIWATGILREYLIKGFNLDRRKLVTSQENLDDLHEAIKFIESKSKSGPMKAKITVRLTKDLVR